MSQRGAKVMSALGGLAVCGMALAKPPGGGGDGGGCSTEQHLFLFEDTNQTMLNSPRNSPAVHALMVQAANQVIAAHGDEFDFVGFWTTFVPGGSGAGAFFRWVRNDVEGIGRPIFDNHAADGISGTRLLGMVMMHDLASHSNPQNALAHEFSHQWVAYLGPLPGSRTITSGGHFNCQIDLQGGCQGTEWTGTSRLRTASAELNVDTGTRYSYLDLYLMGMVTAAEMDAGMSEQRYLDGGCVSPYTGSVSTWSSADIITAAGGPRVPSAANSQKAFRTAWVVIHLPGSPPTSQQKSAILAELQSFGTGWSTNTLGRSTMDQTLFTDANCDGIQDMVAAVSGAGAGCEADVNGDGTVDAVDLTAFLSDWLAGSEAGAWASPTEYLAAWIAGCP